MAKKDWSKIYKIETVKIPSKADLNKCTLTDYVRSVPIGKGIVVKKASTASWLYMLFSKVHGKGKAITRRLEDGRYGVIRVRQNGQKEKRA